MKKQVGDGIPRDGALGWILYTRALAIVPFLPCVRWVWSAACKSPHPEVAVLDGWRAVFAWLARVRAINSDVN